jgi:hypothetical protein
MSSNSESITSQSSTQSSSNTTSVPWYDREEEPLRYKITVPPKRTDYVTPFPIDGSEITNPKYKGETRAAIVARYRDLINFTDDLMNQPNFSRRVTNQCKLYLRDLHEKYGEEMGIVNSHIFLGPCP